ncbi:TPA: hypothetical protein RQJ80_004301 [Vibrio vulnificus]|uniref:hypothetical protein n=1 Tax=Vibrio TaxID=662 RepID=UPI001F1DB88E|nr:hypothetical protein [Vibrio sp. D54]MCF7511922.1 hypothetical protein [Vibrio sp. D54]HDY7635463.1 hypothetical protein [Vibrio vulnificus]
MSNDDLFSYMKNCALDRKKAPIRVVSDDVLIIGLSLLINNSEDIIKVLTTFKGKERNPLLDALSDDLIISNVIDYLEDSKREFLVLTDDSKKLKKSNFFSKLKGKIKVNTIPQKMLTDADVLKRGVNFVVGDNDALIVGSFDYTNENPSDLSVPTFINYFDESFNRNLSEYFNSIRDRCLNGGLSYV